jgi:hypothetical protein
MLKFLVKFMMLIMFVVICFSAQTTSAADYDNFNGSGINSGLWGSQNRGVFSVSGGLLNANSPPYFISETLWSKYTFSGDGEFVLDYRNFSTTATYGNTPPQIGLTVYEENNSVYIGRHGSTSENKFVTWGPLGLVATAPASTSSGMLKVARTGSTTTTYYNEGSGWNLLGTFSMSGDFTVHVGVYTGENGTFHATSDYISFTGFTVVPPENPVDIKLQCPSSVNAGFPLNVTVNIENSDCFNSVTMGHAMVSLNGNSNNTLSGMGMWGPYKKTFSSWTLPAATCLPNFTSSKSSKSIQVISAVPSSLANTLSMVIFRFLSPSGEMSADGQCWVKVNP